MTAPATSRLGRDLWWLTLALTLSYLAVAAPLPVIPLYVTGRLGLGSGAGGLAAGLPFITTIATRLYAGRFADRWGGRRGMVRGLAVYIAANLIGLASTIPALPHLTAYGVLLAGRLLLGLGESLTLVGMLGWGINVAGTARAGRFIALMGMGMYAALALGAPLGLGLDQRAGFAAVMLAGVLLPLAGLVMIRPLPPAVAHEDGRGGGRPGLWTMLRAIGRPGIVVGLQGVGIAAIGAFAALDFVRHGWPRAWLGLTCFAAGFVLMRIVGGRLPDRLGGVPVAIVSLGFEALGQLVLFLAPGPLAALAGAMLTGLGCSLVYPCMAIVVVRRVDPRLRATAMGSFSAFQDLAYATTGPLAGLLADRFGVPVAFLVGAVAAASGFVAAVTMARTGSSGDLRPA
ncbi:MAG: arabinose transporter [Rhodospirillales bacterium]|nr:arabinose transporter [Rhodospirillales bacterium]